MLKKTKNQRVVALLPIKENSARVHGKNFKTLAGMPLFRWILNSLLSVELIDAVVINTDARRILTKFGMEHNNKIVIRDRKANLRGDYVDMNLILADDIKNVPADLYFMTHTTNPLLSPSTINNALEAFNSNTEADSLFTVNKIQSRLYRTNMSAINHDPERLIPTQDLDIYYEENSCLYIFTDKSFGQTNRRIGRNPMVYITPKIESIDIDEQEDWDMAEALALHHKKNC